jgi:hypothetical protein
MNSHLNVIIAWRIASYHVPLVITWIALMRLALGKVTVTRSDTSKLVSEEVLPDPLSSDDKSSNVHNENKTNLEKHQNLEETSSESKKLEDKKDRNETINS